MKSKYTLLFRLCKLESVSVCVYMQVHMCVYIEELDVQMYKIKCVYT